MDPQVRLRCCVLDFDGIVLESADLKLAAFIDLFAGLPESKRIADYLAANNGLSRYVKFRYISTHFLDTAYGPEREADLDRRFSAMVLEKVLACPFVPGAAEFLAECPLPIYIVSAMPLRELMVIVEGRGLTSHFKGLYGSPGSKDEQLADVAKREGVLGDGIMFVGDSPKDLEAARSAGTRFIGRRNLEEFGSVDIPIYADMFGVLSHLRGLW